MNSIFYVFVLGVILLLLTGVGVWAQSSVNFNLEWSVIAGGGGTSESANYTVRGTAGQPATGPPPATSGSYGVTSGVWGRTTPHLYLPVIIK